jgi:hypothetical protein
MPEIAAMKKFFLRVAISCTTCLVGVSLTDLSKLLGNPDLGVSVVREEQAQCAEGCNRDKQLLLQIYGQYGPAQTRHDREFFERVEADDFILFINGQLLSREEDMRELENSPMNIVYNAEIDNVQIVGDGAVVTGRMTASQNGSCMSWRWIDVWIKRGDTWLIQSTTSLH